MVEKPFEILTHILPLWIWYQPTIALWIYSGKPLWKTLLVCYSISSLGILMAYYFGAGLIQILFRFISKKLKRKFDFSSGKINFSSQRSRFLRWLNEQSVWIILIIFIIPIPLSGVLPVIAMKLKGIKYGLWYLLGANFLSLYLILLGIYGKVS
jgi:membrane protein YqaA with SNARE-associated domain